MNQIAEIAKKHQIGNPGDYVSFMHAGIASDAARQLATIEEQTEIGPMEAAWLRRMGEVLGDARYYEAARPMENGLLSGKGSHYFRPQALSS